MRIVQFRTPDGERKVGKVSGERLLALEGVATTYDLARRALATRQPLPRLVDRTLGAATFSYPEALQANRLLAPLDHPEPSRFWLTGTGLTHLRSAEARDKMHTASQEESGRTDSMRMFEMGLRGGKPGPGETGVQPEWFFKGNGTSVVAPGAPLPSPPFALCDGDEIEICALYLVDDDGTPCRIGFSLGNEFSDHRMEEINYLYLGHAKLRPCALGPELLLADLPDEVRGSSRILRDGGVFWEEAFLSGERHMSHTLANLEHHLFKYALFRRPGDLHGHFLGTGTASFSRNIVPQPGDVFELEAEGFGAPLRNVLQKETAQPFSVRPLYAG